MKAMKRLSLILLILTIFLSIIPLSQAANSPSLNGLQVFPEDNIWNTRVDTLPVDAKSAIYIADLKKDTAPYTGIHHYIRTAIPYNVVTSAQSHQYISSFGYPAYADNVAYPIPSNPLFEHLFK
jgi:thioredoxin-related protein